MLTMSSALGSVLIISILQPFFSQFDGSIPLNQPYRFDPTVIAVVLVAIMYKYFSGFYSASAREMKRLDSMLRSVLYAHFSESLSGLPTIRSYGAIDRFVRDNKYFVDLEDRALFLTVTNQRSVMISNSLFHS